MSEQRKRGHMRKRAMNSGECAKGLTVGATRARSPGQVSLSSMNSALSRINLPSLYFWLSSNAFSCSHHRSGAV